MSVKENLSRKGFGCLTKGLFVFFFLLGAFCTNLDRLGNLPARLAEVERQVPWSIRRLLPMPKVPYGTSEKGAALSGRIIRVYDGDTAILLDEQGERRYRVRFYGIDAPEAAQTSGPESGDYLRDLIEGKEVKLEIMDVDQYGRQVAKVFLGDQYVNLAMVRAGWAWYYEAYAKNDAELVGAEESARREGIGLWSRPSPEPPWEYRRRK